MTEKQLKRLSEVLPRHRENLRRYKPEEILGKEFTLLSVTWRAGEHGDYAVLYGRLGDGEEFTVATGARAVMTTLSLIQPYLPIICRFGKGVGKTGKGYLVIE